LGRHGCLKFVFAGVRRYFDNGSIDKKSKTTKVKPKKKSFGLLDELEEIDGVTLKKY